MPGEPNERIYWDACCFISYINGHAERLPVLQAILEAAFKSGGNLQIVTSVISKVEVAFTATEKLQRQLNASEEERIQKLLMDTSVVALAELHELVADRSAQMVRQAMQANLGLKPADAIHLATAERVRASEFQTYDKLLLGPGFSAITPLRIREPKTGQPFITGFQLPDLKATR